MYSIQVMEKTKIKTRKKSIEVLFNLQWLYGLPWDMWGHVGGHRSMPG